MRAPLDDLAFPARRASRGVQGGQVDNAAVFGFRVLSDELDKIPLGYLWATMSTSNPCARRELTKLVLACLAIANC